MLQSQQCLDKVKSTKNGAKDKDEKSPSKKVKKSTAPRRKPKTYKMPPEILKQLNLLKKGSTSTQTRMKMQRDIKKLLQTQHDQIEKLRDELQQNQSKMESQVLSISVQQSQDEKTESKVSDSLKERLKKEHREMSQQIEALRRNL